MDSLDPERKAGMWGYADLPSPPKGHPKYPRMQVENRCYHSRVFRKLHIELAHRQDGLQVQLLLTSCLTLHHATRASPYPFVQNGVSTHTL